MVAQLSGGGLSSGGPAIEGSPVSSSKILFSAYPIEKESVSSFLIEKFTSLESKVADYDKLPPNAKAKLDGEIRQVVSSALDLESLSKRAMIAYWDDISKLPQGARKLLEYQKLFKELVEENYLDKARDYINREHRIFLTSEEDQSRFKVIKGRLKKSDADVFLEFKMQKQPPAILDIKLDDTSLESTYRSSFNRIIRGKDKLEEGFQELLRVMRTRLADLKKEGATRL